MTDLFNKPGEPGGQTTQATPEQRRVRDRRRRAKRRAQRRRNIVSFLVMIVALALLVGGGWVLVRPLLAQDQAEQISDYPGPGFGNVEIVVHKGESGREIAATLTEANVVASEEAFVAAYRANEDASSIQAGTYDLQKEMRASDAVRALLDPASRADMMITVPEGTRAKDIYERIAGLLQIDVSEVEQAADTVAAEYLPEEAEGHIEGWLRASTYNVTPDDTPESILKTMVDRTVKTLDEMKVPKDKREEMLTIASIIEAEVVLPKDRGKVARVVENRLAGCSGDGTIGMDSTYAYGLNTPASQITSEQWGKEHPYNTRTTPGLPPTPINSPGEPSLSAALDPPKGDWCYFVTVNLDTGKTLFAETYKEHQKNREVAREWLEKNR